MQRGRTKMREGVPTGVGFPIGTWTSGFVCGDGDAQWKGRTHTYATLEEVTGGGRTVLSHRHLSAVVSSASAVMITTDDPPSGRTSSISGDVVTPHDGQHVQTAARVQHEPAMLTPLLVLGGISRYSTVFGTGVVWPT